MKVIGLRGRLLGATVIALASCGAVAQTTVQTAGTTSAGTVPVFGPSANATVTNSPITISGSNVGIGTTSPVAPLDVESGGIRVGAIPAQSANGAFSSSASDGHWISFYPSLGGGNYNGIVQAGDQGIIYSNGSWGTGAFVLAPWANAISGLRMDSNGDVGIYTASNYSGISAATASALSITNATPSGGFVTSIGYTNIGVSSILATSGTSAKAAYYSYVANGVANNVGLYIDGVATGANYGVYSPVAGLQSYFNGNVGIGTTAPSYKLDVAGQIHTSGSVVFADGSTQSTAWTGSLCGGDYAESVDVADDRTKYEPGDVLVLDSANPGKILKSIGPYSIFVSGIYSTKPGVIGRRQLTEKSASEVPMAIVGIVPTKVSTENGSIRVGDLLVTSATPGYAMKGTDHSRMLGAVIGKAMGNLDSGTGVIEVLVSLQ